MRGAVIFTRGDALESKEEGTVEDVRATGVSAHGHGGLGAERSLEAAAASRRVRQVGDAEGAGMDREWREEAGVWREENRECREEAGVWREENREWREEQKMKVTPKCARAPSYTSTLTAP
jgi:hypothetical protein